MNAIARNDESPDFYVTDEQERLQAWLNACPVELDSYNAHKVRMIVEQQEADNQV